MNKIEDIQNCINQEINSIEILKELMGKCNPVECIIISQEIRIVSDSISRMKELLYAMKG